MNELIEFAKDQCEIFPEDSDMGMFLREVIKILEIKAIPLDKVKQAREEIIGESFPEDADSFCKMVYLGGCIRNPR